MKMEGFFTCPFYFEGAKYYDEDCNLYTNELPDGYSVIDGHIMVEGTESDEIRFVNDNDKD